VSVYDVYGGEKESAYNTESYLYSSYEAAISYFTVLKRSKIYQASNKFLSQYQAGDKPLSGI